jgi:hypothetical protein
VFLKCRPSSHDFNKLIIKYNMLAKYNEKKYFFLWFFSMLNYDNMIYFLEILPYAKNQNI